jgi:hypothetical protein
LARTGFFKPLHAKSSPASSVAGLARGSIATFGQPTGQVLFARRIDSGRDE